MLASLNHPNIAHIHGLEDSDGVRALVMELVEGPTLAEKLAQGSGVKAHGLPLDEALPIARQIAEALEAAHEQGIVHRDLKPANIKVTPNGVVKVLDFGLAKAMESAGSRQQAAGGDLLSMSPTLSMQATQAGIILGTAAYMSPEQARGTIVDKRANLWAFGVVLFEMLTGRRLFEGGTISDTLAAVLKTEPDWNALPDETPRSIHRLLRRCLEKDRRKRLESAADARLEIDEALATPMSDGSTGVAPGTTLAHRTGWRRAMPSIAAGVASAAVVGVAVWALMRGAPAPRSQPMRFAIVPPAAQPLVISGLDRDSAISPDGRHLVYFAGTGQTQLMVRAIDQLDAVPLRGITGARAPFMSPDGRWVGFFSGAELKKVSITGGPPITLCRIPGTPRGASWGQDDTIVFATSDAGTGLLSVPAGGGEPKVLTKPDLAQGERDHMFPSMLPGGRAVLFTITPNNGAIENAQVAVLDLTTGQRKTLIRGGSSAEYVDTGHLVFAAAGTLRAVRFDLGRLEVLGDPVPVVEQVSTAPTGAANFSVSRQGTLVYMRGGAGGQTGSPRSLVWVNRKGIEEPIKAPPRAYVYPRLSPDGTRVALDIRDQESDIWIWDLARQTLTRLTFGPDAELYPVWTPDSRRIIFYSTRAGGGNLFWQPADGTGTVERLTTSSTTPHYPYSISPDGKSLVFQENVPKTGIDLSLLLFGEPGGSSKSEVRPLVQTTFTETSAEISPDGHWLAYPSNESGQEEIFVRPFPKVDTGRWQISTGGGTRPLWARSGRELFFLDGNSFLTTVPVQTTPAFSAGNPTRVLNTRYFSGFGAGGQNVAGRTYDVSPDGQRFLMIKDIVGADQTATPASMIVVLNWLEELKAKVPGPK